jgi:type VI protein secretion system component Hcp
MKAVGRRDVLLGIAGLVAAGVLVDLDVARAASNGVVAIDGIGQFDIISYSWGSGSVNSKTRDLSFVKDLDAYSSELATAAASGQVFAAASLTVAGKNGKSVRYDMTDVLVSSYSVSGVTESVTLHFASLKTARR